MAERALFEPLAAHLRSRLDSGSREEQARAAEALGRLYVRMLTDAKAPEARQRLEDQSRELLRRVPESDSFELRINLAKASYLPVEETVEQDRLKMATDAQRAEAQRVLAQIAPQFDELANKLHRRVEQLERKEALAKEADLEGVRAELADARRLRSLARYYSGWAAYYTAVLTRNPRLAQRALEDFGYLLNAVPGKAASIERLPKNMLRYEHVARAAVACGLCTAMLGGDVESVRWLDEVEQAEGVPEGVLDHLFSRRLIVYAATSRWADVEVAVRRRRGPTAGTEKPLVLREARLLTVLCLEALRDPAMRPGLRAIAEKLSQLGLGDLVTQGEAGHVLDLVRLYGTAPIGQEGFIVGYVRGLQAFERAREAHRAAGGNPEDTASAADVINAYREAAGVLGSAAGSGDSGKFPAERAKAGVRRGLALFYAGDFPQAAEAFLAAGEGAPADIRRDALWYAIVGLDRAIERGKPSLTEQRDRLATLYLKEFPGTENAVKLLLRQTRADSLTDDAALDILLGIPPESALYPAARRQASRTLYEGFRRAPEGRRDFAGLRFAEVAEQVLRLEHARAMGDRDPAGLDAAKGVAVRARQLADVLLGLNAPDVPRARAALDALASAADYQGLDLRPYEDELGYRRMQIGLIAGDAAAVERELAALRARGGTFASAAERLLYRDALRAWKAAGTDPAAARRVVRYGQRVLESAAAASLAPGEASVVALRDSVADAAAAVYRAEHDTIHRDLALKLDREQLAAGTRSASSLRRLAELTEAAGDAAAAGTYWNELLAGSEPGGDRWFEARFHTIRLLATAAPGDAITALKQHKVLYPTFGPPPWGSKLEELERAIVNGTPPPGGAP